jgi:hypothetical protein
VVAARLVLVVLAPLLAAATPVELAIHVAVGDDGAPVADAAWIADQVAAASAPLGGADVTLTWRDAGDAGIAGEILTVADRDALAAAAAEGGVVHVFVVARLADKDEDGRWLSGVHWRYGGGTRAWRGRRYVILSRETRWTSTLAHELGHFFGLGHTDHPDGLMTTGVARSGAPPFLDDRQLRRVRARARAWARAAGRAPSRR